MMRPAVCFCRLALLASIFVTGCRERDTGPRKQPEDVTAKPKLEERTEKLGDLVARTQFKRGPDGKEVNHGRYLVTYDSGKKAGEGAFADGKETGIWRAWHRNGRLRMEGRYVFGRKDGPWTWWDENGKIEKEERYSHGQKQAASSQSAEHPEAPIPDQAKLAEP